MLINQNSLTVEIYSRFNPAETKDFEILFRYKKKRIDCQRGVGRKMQLVE